MQACDGDTSSTNDVGSNVGKIHLEQYTIEEINRKIRYTLSIINTGKKFYATSYSQDSYKNLFILEKTRTCTILQFLKSLQDCITCYNISISI